MHLGNLPNSNGFSKLKCEFSLWSKEVSECRLVLQERSPGLIGSRHWSLFYCIVQQGKLDKGNYSSLLKTIITLARTVNPAVFLCRLCQWHSSQAGKVVKWGSQLISDCTVSPLWKVIFQATNVCTSTPACSISCQWDLCPALCTLVWTLAFFFLNASTHNWVPEPIEWRAAVGDRRPPSVNLETEFPCPRPERKFPLGQGWGFLQHEESKIMKKIP
jgi:hypothetical protein